MDAKKCDKCAEYYVDYTRQLSVGEVWTGKLFLNVLPGAGFTEPSSFRVPDLCKRCLSTGLKNYRNQLGVIE